MSITIENVSKHFGSFHAIDNVSLKIKNGSLVALLGPSGSGKSTLLRMIAGLEPPDSGQIYLIGEDATQQSVQERHIGFVFQHYALFKHMSIRKNIAFAMEIRKVPKDSIRRRVDELLDLVQLTGLGDRYPSQLSGGQRQRVALARSLAVQPKVLLLDEPFGALDAKVRKELRSWLHNLHKEVNITTVFVTHDQEEAMEVADEIVVMNQGRVEQVGTPAEIYDKPATAFVMTFIGPVNVLPNAAGLFASNGTTPQNSGAAHCELVFWRPHDVEIQTKPESGFALAKVSRIIHVGREIQTQLLLESGQVVTAYVSRDRFDYLQLKQDQQVYVKAKHAMTFPAYSA